MPFSMLIMQWRGNQSKTLLNFEIYWQQDIHQFYTRESIEARQIFENVCTEVSSPGNSLLSKKTFAESSQRNQRHKQWNPTKLSTSCLPVTGNTHTAWVLWHVTLESTVTTLTFSLCNLSSLSSNWDQKTSPIWISYWWKKKFLIVPVSRLLSSFCASIFSSWEQIRSMSVVAG